MEADEHFLRGRFQGEVLARLQAIDEKLLLMLTRTDQLEKRVVRLENLSTQLRTVALVIGPALGLLAHRLVEWLQLWPKK